MLNNPTRVVALFFLFFSFEKGHSQTTDDIQSKRGQFDFWIGEWDVNLRTKQADYSWADQKSAIARIYSMMDGQAILELWEEQGNPKGIVGYSFRYYDRSLNKWILWLNWPAPNRSASIQMLGSFRNNRGEFFGERPLNDSTRLISRYTFSDITKTSLRWDDAYSSDKGKTWTNNWIMEFNRTQDLAPTLEIGPKNHTSHNLQRCQRKEFQIVQELATKKEFTTKNGKITFYGILEGCAVMAIVNSVDTQEISILTFNTYAGLYEQLVFDKTIGSAAMYYGTYADGTITLRTQDPNFDVLRLLKVYEEGVSISSSDKSGKQNNVIF